MVVGSSLVLDKTIIAVIYLATPSCSGPGGHLNDPDSDCWAQYRQARDQGAFPLLMWWETPPQVSIHALHDL